MADHQHEYVFKTMCRVLEVSGRGYYAWKKLTPSRRSREVCGTLNGLSRLIRRTGRYMVFRAFMLC
jgi:hypothetical protein